MINHFDIVTGNLDILHASTINDVISAIKDAKAKADLPAGKDLAVGIQYIIGDYISQHDIVFNDWADDVLNELDDYICKYIEKGGMLHFYKYSSESSSNVRIKYFNNHYHIDKEDRKNRVRYLNSPVIIKDSDEFKQLIHSYYDWNVGVDLTQCDYERIY